jgi:hypothetical protein
MMAGGASIAPSRKSFPGLAIAQRIISPCSSKAATTAAMTTGKARSLPHASLSGFGKKSGTSVNDEILQLLCFPEPLIPLKGFSCKSAARPCLAATSSMTCIMTRF